MASDNAAQKAQDPHYPTDNSLNRAAGQPVSEDLAVLRAGIDAVDSELLKLLNARADLSLRVGAWKRIRGEAVLQPQREALLLEALKARNAALGGALPAEHLARIWREVLSSSRALQQPLTVAFLGPEGTFSHMAVLECLGESIVPLPGENLPAVFRAVAEGRAAVGVVPLENSLQGGIGQCLDLFGEYRMRIAAEHYSRISLSLLSREDSLAAVRRVYSHPQPLGQCAGWLRARLPGVPALPDESTAAAARRALNEPGAAAIGHPRLAVMLGLNLLAESLEDLPGNWTRFALILPDTAQSVPGIATSASAAGASTGVLGAAWAQGADALKTSLLFTVRDEPGALARVLALLAEGGVNLSKLESRPLRGTPWQYTFFADVECDLLLPEHAAILEHLRQVCQSVRLLGVYARARRPA